MNTDTTTTHPHYGNLSDDELTRLAWNVAIIDELEYTDGMNTGPARGAAKELLDPLCPHCGSDAVSLWADDGEDDTADRMDCGFCGWNVDDEPLPTADADLDEAPDLRLACDPRFMVCLDGGPPPLDDEPELTRNDELDLDTALAFALRLRDRYPLDLVTMVVEPRTLAPSVVVEWDGGFDTAADLDAGHAVAERHGIPRDEYRIVENVPDGAVLYQGGA